MTARVLAVLLAALALLLAAACDDGDGAAPDEAFGPSDVIAFGAQTPAGHGLYLVKPDGTGLRELVSEGGDVGSPVWSPAGGRIAYVVGTPGSAGVTLRLYDFETNAATTVSGQALVGELEPAVSWSPDGRRLAFAEAGSDGPLIRVYDAASAEVVDLPPVSGFTPDWSPDGERLVFASGEGEPDLYVMDAGGGSPEALLERPGAEESPRWSPDGERIVFTAQSADAAELAVLEVETGDVGTIGAGLTPSWQADGSRLAFAAAPAGDETDLDIFYANAAGGEPSSLGRSVTRDVWPSWSPDGERIAYLGQVDRQTALICVVRLDTEERGCLDLQDLLPASPAWSPR